MKPRRPNKFALPSVTAPFGHPIFRHYYVAKLLGVRPRELAKMPLRRKFYQQSIIYDPAEILALLQQAQQTKDHQPS